MNKTSYTYTGAEVVLDYKVVVDGVELEKGVDYDEVITNGTNVGDGILTVTGKGDYDKTSATAKFTITPASTSDVKVEPKNKIVYDGTKHTPSLDELKITLNGNDVSSQFKLSYPTSKTANVNAGEGTVTLTPVKNNKNFTGSSDAKFTIEQAVLNGGEIVAYDAKESKVKWNDAKFAFTYDGNDHEYAKTLYKFDKPTDKKVVTADDYEIRYVDNVYGWGQEEAGTAYALVIAKGNYKNAEYDLAGVVKDGVYTCENGTKISNVVKAEPFKINRLVFHKENITVSNGSYNSGFDVDPVVTVNYNGKQLVKDKDFELVYKTGTDRKNVTNGKVLEVEVIGKGGYRRAGETTFKWGIDKFDLKDAEIIVSGTDADPVVKVMNRNVLVDEKNYTVEAKDGKVTVTATENNDHYTGSKTVDIKEALEKPETPVIEKVTVVGNKATVVLSEECDGAVGYDYVISPNVNCINDKDYTAVNKNKLTTETTFQYVQQDTYYAYCHAWTRDENGKKVFSGWSEAYPFMITATTPEQPVITNVKVKGSTVTVSYTKSNAALGYDVVLGSKMATVLDERRPVEYGTLVKKNIKGDTVTATFKNVPKGTYYVGLHAFNRTSVDGKKVFSPWSQAKRITVK